VAPAFVAKRRSGLSVASVIAMMFRASASLPSLASIAEIAVK
jgi:hypothetical protein